MEQHELPQLLAVLVNVEAKTGLEEHSCHPLLILMHDKIMPMPILDLLVGDMIFQSRCPARTFTITSCITLTLIIWLYFKYLLSYFKVFFIIILLKIKKWRKHGYCSV